MEENVRKWALDATDKLNKARKIGGLTDSLLQQTKNSIKTNNENLILGNFLLGSISQQLLLLQTIFESIELNIEDKRLSIDILMNYMSNIIGDLEIEVDNLKLVKVDRALSKDEPSLYEFVSHDLFESLQRDINSIDSVLIDLIQQVELKQTEIRTRIDLFNKDYLKLEKEIDDISEASWIDEYIEENNKFEEELASLLESLTNHYDQCSKGIRIIEDDPSDITESEKLELFAVLENDFGQVPEVLNDIEEVHKDIEERCGKINSYLKTQSFDMNLKKLSNELFEFGEVELINSINLLNQNSNIFTEKTIEMNSKCDEAGELIKLYQKFVKSYHSLILELERRNKVQISINQIIQDANDKIESFQEEDSTFKKSFLQNNGTYLPADLWPGIRDDSPLIRLDLPINTLPQVQSETLKTAKTFLNR